MRASPFATVTSAATASSSSAGFSPPRPRSESAAARLTSVSTCSSVRALSVKTRARESRGEITSNDGFSVVAPTSTTVPFSMCGRMTSCCALLKRCISSMNRIVRWAVHPEPVAGLLHDAAQIGHAGADRADGAEVAARERGDQARQRRLARAGRPPQHHRRNSVGFDRPAQRPSGADDMLLAHELVERARAHPGGQRRLAAQLALRAVFEQRQRFTPERAAGAGGGRALLCRARRRGLGDGGGDGAQQRLLLVRQHGPRIEHDRVVLDPGHDGRTASSQRRRETGRVPV